MKRIFALAFTVILIIILLTSFVAPKDQVLNSLGKYDQSEYYSEGGFQDYTDYAKYYFASVEIDGNEYFNRIQDSDIEVLNEHLDNFESWIKVYREGDSSREIVVNYDFDRALIDNEDYIYINSEKHEWDDGFVSLVNYDVYFFDSQTKTLYYFHNNI